MTPAQQSQVRSAFAALSDEERAVLSLAHFEHLTLRQIADRTGMPIDDLHRQATAALHHFKRALGDPTAL